MNPYKLREIYKYLTRAKKVQPDLPDVFPASKAPIPAKTKDVEEIEAINRFMRNNPRVEKAGGGMLVQPSVDGSRPGYKEDKYTSPSSILKNVDIPEKTKQKYVVLLKGINKWKKDPSAENWIEIFRRGDGLNQTQESLNVRRYITGKSYQGKDLFPQVKEHFEKMNLKKIIGPDVKLIKDYTPEYFKKTRMLVATQASAVAKLANSADEVREIAPFFKRAKDPQKLNVLNMTKKLVNGYNSLNEYDKIAAIENVSKRVSRYLEFLEGDRKVGKLQKPQNAKEIISFIKSNMSNFEFGTSTIRNMKFSARDAALGLKRGTTRNTRAILYGLKQPNQVIDEVAGLSATYKNAPGYTELTQLISPEINQLKNTKIDVPLSSRFMKNIMAGDFKDKETYNKAAKLFMKENPGVDIPILVTGENLEPSKYIKNFEDLSPQAKKNITEIAKKNKFVFKTDALPIKSLIASLGGGTCSVFSGKKAALKADGGRIGLQSGTPNIDDCFKSGSAVINSGKVPVDKADDFAQLLKRVGNIGRGIMKFGIIPEALYATADSLVRVGMGDTFTEAGLRATDYLLPGDQTKTAEISKVSRIFGDETGELVGRTIDYKNQLAKIQSLEDQKANLDNLSDGGEFSYIGDLTNDANNVEKQLTQARNDLDNKFKISEAEQLFAESKQDDAYDASKATSFLSNLKRKYRDSSDNLSDVETLAAPEKTQMQLNLDMLPAAPRDFMMATDDQIRNYVLRENEISGKKLDPQIYIDEKEKLKKDFMTKGPDVYGKEQVYGTQGTFGGEPVDMTNYKPSNRFGSESQQRPVLYPDGRGTLAGGGIAKLAGVSSGTAPVRGPNPQGLPGLLKRGIKI